MLIRIASELYVEYPGNGTIFLWQGKPNGLFVEKVSIFIEEIDDLIEALEKIKETI
jgi:hypothetical protein